MSAATLPSVEDVRRWLESVPDPEIPVVSLMDLGIIRDVAVEGGEVVVGITPTYSGCPATAVIALDVETALRAQGVERLRIERRLSPPWTTDWISPEGREKLLAYGIAPPVTGFGAKAVVACPRCGAGDTEKVSQFGSTPCKAHYRCRACLEPFDYFKCI